MNTESGAYPFGFHNNKKAIPKFFFTKLRLKNFLASPKKTIRETLKKNNLIRNTVIKLRTIAKKKKKSNTMLDKNKISKLLSTKSPVIFEIGAGDGGDTLDFLKIFDSVDAKLFVFEPEPKNIAILKNRIKDQRFNLFEGAVSDIDGKVWFHRSRTSNSQDLSLSGSIMKPKNVLKIWNWIYFDQNIQISSITIDVFCKMNNIQKIDFIWCDAQGAEERIIMGGQESFKNKVRYFYTEYSNEEQYENQPTLKKILQLLPSFEIIEDFGTDVLLKNKNIK